MEIHLSLLGNTANVLDNAHLNHNKNPKFFICQNDPDFVTIGITGIAEGIISCEDAERLAAELNQACQKKKEKKENK